MRHQEPNNEATSQGLAKHPLGTELETFKFKWHILTHWATVAKTTLHLYFMKFISSGKSIICIRCNCSLSATILNLFRKLENLRWKKSTWASTCKNNSRGYFDFLQFQVIRPQYLHLFDFVHSSQPIYNYWKQQINLH